MLVHTDYTEDYIYGNRILMRQPKNGHCTSVDAIILSATITPKAHEKVLDVGAGVGTTSLCLGSRCPHAKIFGIEVQKDCVHIARNNIQANGLQASVDILWGDLVAPPPRLPASSYDYVLSNPPHFDSKPHRTPVASKLNGALHYVTLEAWLRFCLLMVKPNGVVTLICPPDNLDKILSALHDKLGNIILFPIWDNKDSDAKRVIITGIKGSHLATKVVRGLILHNNNGDYTRESDAILRESHPLDLGL